MSVRRCDAAALELGAGLEVLVAAALQGVAEGGELDVVTASRAAALELPGWARLAGHDIVDERVEGRGPARQFVVRVRRGGPARVLPPRHEPVPLQNGGFHTASLRLATPPPPERADPSAGFVPAGALAEPAASSPRWSLNERDRLWADELAELTEQASSSGWDATTDVPWEAAHGLPDDVERAVAQVMTFIAQNEYAALYVPARFLPHVNPSYVEVLLWLASHVQDEARHIEVFTKRALAGGCRGYALASAELSTRTLLEESDFTAAALLLNVLGEGTFLDLLAFVGHHGPDAATAAAARLAHADERRHVHFGIAHVRRRLALEPEEREQLVAAVEARAAKLTSLSGLSAAVTEALTVIAARSFQPAELAEAAAAVRSLMARMETNRVRRLRAAGFDEPTARYLSELHTPNLM